MAAGPEITAAAPIAASRSAPLRIWPRRTYGAVRVGDVHRRRSVHSRGARRGARNCKRTKRATNPAARCCPVRPHDRAAMADEERQAACRCPAPPGCAGASGPAPAQSSAVRSHPAGYGATSIAGDRDAGAGGYLSAHAAGSASAPGWAMSVRTLSRQGLDQNPGPAVAPMSAAFEQALPSTVPVEAKPIVTRDQVTATPVSSPL